VLRAVTTPRPGEYINETTFLSSPDALESAQWGVFHGRATHVAAFSDGLQMLALDMPAGTPHQPFFAPFLRFASEAQSGSDATDALVSFLAGSRITARTDDDVTLLLAARR
jgi:hypothetical protein